MQLDSAFHLVGDDVRELGFGSVAYVDSACELIEVFWVLIIF